MIDIGCIGLGTMGRPMAGHLLAAGHRLPLHDFPPTPELVVPAGHICGIWNRNIGRLRTVEPSSIDTGG
jgi:3-hydroxyisobutyrate dehydrogenase-like beta-hydroxyacid dehydrogenase